MGPDPIGPELMGPEPSIERERVALVRVAAKLNEIVHKSEAERTGFAKRFAETACEDWVFASKC